MLTLYRLGTTSISKNNFRKLLKLSTSCVQFTFNSQIYFQHDIIAMGMSLEETLSNILTCFIERKVISKYKATYFRYVDNCFILGKMKKKLILQKKKKNYDELAFLKVLVKRRKTNF